MKKWEVPGLAIAVVKDGRTVLSCGFGVCETGHDRPVTADTFFSIASCNKTFTAATVGLLVDQGKLNWDDPVAQHLSGFELADPYLTAHLTLRDLLSHRTGLRRADLLGDGAGFDRTEIFRRLKHLEPIAEPLTRLIYNNHMYGVLREVVSRVSGQPWEQFAREHIFGPLEMKSTTAKVSEVSRDRLAPRHWRSDSGIIARPASRFETDTYSTVNDLARWLTLQLAEGAHNDFELLRRRTVREMHALQFSVPVKLRPTRNQYAAQFYGSGLGWFVQDYRGRKVVSHSGSWGAMIAMIPEEQLGVVVLSNLDLESLPGLLMYDVFDAYLVEPALRWDRDKWDAVWSEPPGHAYRPRDEAKAILEKTRTAGTKPSLPLEEFAGTYESRLYGKLTVSHDDGWLSVKFGEYTTPLSHWQNDAFYARTPIRLTFDWLLTFGLSSQGHVEHVTVTHVGWDEDERDHVFVLSQ